MDLCKENVYLKNCVKVFPEGGEFVNITDPEGGPTAIYWHDSGGWYHRKKVAVHPLPHRLINGTALSHNCAKRQVKAWGRFFFLQ